MTDHVFISGNVSGFNCHITVAEKDVRHIKFERGQYKTSDDELAAAIDHAVANTAIGRFVRRVDEAAAREWLAKHRQTASAIQGGATALDARSAMDRAMAERDSELQKATQTNPRLNAELETAGVTVTEKVALPLQTGAPGATEEANEDKALEVEIVRPARVKLGAK